VLVVDDSVLMGRQIAKILDDDPEIEVVGRAKDGQECLDMIQTLKPHVVTLDVEMPVMNGITALKHIMVKYAVPTVMISALTKEGARTTFEALKYGAVDVIAKPSKRQDESLEAQKHDIVSKVKRAASIRMGRSRYVRMAQPDVAAKVKTGPAADRNTRFIGVGAGTGGYYSLLRVAPSLPKSFQDVVVAMLLVSNRYLAPYVSYLAEHSQVRVKHLQDHEIPQRGTLYLCSGEDGVILSEDSNGQLMFQAKPAAETTNPGRHAVDDMFASLARMLGERAMGIVMSGRGTDGAMGITAIRDRGGLGVVQDITNCMDPSMPLAVLQMGTVDKVLPDYLMAELIVNNESH
jgi:two-component system chemotaxis response regulator CheB